MQPHEVLPFGKTPWMKKDFSAVLDVRRRTSAEELRLDSWHEPFVAKPSSRN
jgi:hypothetical protein